MTVSVNLVTDFGAIGDGIASDTPAFNAFKAWGQLQTEDIELTIPGGRYLLSPASGFHVWFCDEILQPLTILGYGATVINPKFGSIQGSLQTTLDSARFATATIGSTQIRLVTLADISKFAVGKWLNISAIDLMGYGQPPNHQLFEFNQITAIDTVTGTISLLTPLANTYKSTYPVFGPGDNFNPDQGGPATIYNMDRGWPCQIYVYGLTIEGADFAYFKGMECLFEDCIFNGNGIAPTEARIHTLRNCIVKNTSEIDKSVEHLYIYNSTFQGQFKVQSSSVGYMLVEDSTFERFLHGTAYVTEIRNSSMPDLIIGPIAYGTRGSLTLEDCTIDQVRYARTGNVFTDFTVSNGTMAQVKDLPTQWGQPGAWMIHGSEQSGRIFRVLDIREDGTNVYIDTTMPEPVVRPPSQYGVGGLGGPATSVVQYQGLNITATNCTGCDDIVSLCNKGTRPALAYHQRVLTGDFSHNTALGPTVDVFGRVERITIDVSRAYTGILATLGLRANQFNNAWVIFADNSWAKNWGYTINLKIAGTRIITPSGNSGLQAGDSVSSIPAGGIWVPTNVFRPYLTFSIGAEAEPTWPIITLTFEMDHELPGVQIADIGIYSLNGTPAVLAQSLSAKIIASAPGAYALAGQDVAAASSAGPKLITAATAAYALAGASSHTLRQTRIRDMKISELAPAVDLDGSELLPVVQNGVTVQAPISAIRDLPAYFVAEVPDAATAGQGAMIYVLNGNAGAECMAVSDGVFWKVVALGATIAS